MPGVEDPQYAKSGAGRRGAKLILGNLDDPTTASDWNSGEAGSVFSFEPTLRRDHMGGVSHGGRAQGKSRRSKRDGSRARNGASGQTRHGGWSFLPLHCFVGECVVSVI